MAADDFLRCIALDPSSAIVPARDVPVGVEHEDRVVLHALNEEAEPLLTCAQVPLGLAPLREVAGNLAVTDHGARLTANRGDGDAGPEQRPVFPDAPALILNAAVALRV